jgi:hypothetical protein
MSKGGPRHGSGKPISEIARRRQVRVMMTDPEYDDVVLLAQQWDLPVATACYGIFTEALSKMRRVRPQSPSNLVYAASQFIAKHEGSMPSTKIPNGV